MCYRTATKVRGLLVSKTSQKALRLKYAEAQKTAHITLMNSDIRSINLAISRVHNMWASVVQTGIMMYLLSALVGEAIVIVAGPLLRESSDVLCTLSWRLYSGGIGQP